MDESHDDLNFRCKILKIWSKTCVFCCKKYPIPTIIFIFFFLLYLFFPLVFTFVICSSPLVGFSLLVHRLFLDNNHQKVKHVEKDDERRRKFAKSRRSFKSVYSDRNQLIRRNTNDFIDTNVADDDNIFVKSLHDLLTEKKSKNVVNFQSIAGKSEGECSSSNGTNINKDDDVQDDDKPQDHNHNKVVKWSGDDQKNEMDLGLIEVDRNNRLKSLMERRRSRKNLGFEEKESTGNVQISSVKTKKINPFLEDKSRAMKSPDTAPSSLLTTSNPFDIPYDPHEEKIDLTGDNFHEEFTVGQTKEPVFCRHQSFSLGALSHSVIAHDKHHISYHKDLSNKQKSALGFETSSFDNGGENKHIQHDSSISDDSIDSNHPKEEDLTEIEIKTQEEIDSFDERKADINFFYGSNKKAYHVASHSIVSDMQVELSDEDSDPTLDDLDIEKDRESLLNSSNHQWDPDPIQSNHIHETHGASQSSVAQAAPDGLTELATGPASVGSSPKSVLQPEFSADPGSPRNFINEVQQSDNHTRETDSADNVSQQDRNVGQL